MIGETLLPLRVLIVNVIQAAVALGNAMKMDATALVPRGKSERVEG